MTTLTTFFSKFAWKRRISQGIGIIYGVLSIPFTLLVIPALFFISEYPFVTSTNSLFMSALFIFVIIGFAIILLSLGIGFWLQKEWAYNAALFIHGFPLIGEFVRWFLILEGSVHGAFITQPVTSLGYQLWNVFVIAFIVISRTQRRRRTQ